MEAIEFLKNNFGRLVFTDIKVGLNTTINSFKKNDC